MDMLNMVTKILGLARKIKDAHETVDRNKKLCTNIQRNVGALADILSPAGKNTEIIPPCMYRALRNLENALEDVLNLSKNCQEKSTVSHHLTADQMNKMLKDADQNMMNTITIAGFGMKLHPPAPSTGHLDSISCHGHEGERNKENGKCARKEADGEKRRGNKDVEEKTDAERKKEIEKGKKHKDTPNDIEKRGEYEDVDKKIDDERRKKENVKGKKKKQTTPENVEGKTGGPGLVRPKDSSYDILTSSLYTATDDKRKGENGKFERKEADQEKRRGKKVLEEKTDAERKKQTEEEKKHTQNDREKRENEDVEENIDDERKIENGKGDKKDETQDNVKEKRDGSGMVRPNHASDEETYDSSRKEEKGGYYSCSSSCSDAQLEDMIKDLSERDKLQRDSDSRSYKAFPVELRGGARAIAHRVGHGETIALAENEIRVHGTTNIEHNHILKLLGYAYHGGFLYMVQDYYIESLQDRMYGNPSKGKELSWKQCSEIMLCIADGVVYLHEHGVIHMSLHPEAIKIVPECVAKISSLFMSETLTPSVQEGVATSSEKMERRFAPPEYKSHSIFSVKTDVYSYGVLLLELIAAEMYLESSAICKSLPEWVLQHALDNNLGNCIPPRFAKGPDVEDIKRCIRIALCCVEKDPAKRPTMVDVAGWLRNKNQAVPWIYKFAYNTKDTVTERNVATPPTTTSTPTDPEGSGAPRQRRGEQAAGPTRGMTEPMTVQGGSTVRKSKKGTVRKSSKHRVSKG